MRLRILLLGLACVAQLAVAGSTLWHAESALRGNVYRFETVPVDPVDPFRGRYVRIDFPRVSLPRADEAPLEEGGTAFATVETGEDGLARLVAVHGRAPEGVDTVPVRVLHVSEGQASVTLGFDRFYLEEGRAPAVESAIREARGRAVAVVRVQGSDAVLQDLEVGALADDPDLTPLRDRIRAPEAHPLPEALLAAVKEGPPVGLERCGRMATCVAFPVELDGEPRDEYVLLTGNGDLQYYAPVSAEAADAEPTAFAWKARLEPRGRARLPTADALLSALEDGDGGPSPVSPAYRDLRIGDDTYAVPHWAQPR